MSTPFGPGYVGFAGADPGIPQFWDVRAHRFWLGKPGNMIELPSPLVDGYTANGSMGEVEHGLSGGGSAVTRFDSMMRRWTIPFLHLAGRDYQVVNGFYRRLFGAGPWAFVDPEGTNRLTLAQSMCGGLHGVAEGWVTTRGTVGYDSTVAPAQIPSGVLRWAGASTGSLLAAADALSAFPLPIPDPVRGIPYLPAMPLTAYFWVAAASGTANVHAYLSGLAADGSSVHTVTGPTVALTTTPQLVAVIVPDAGEFTTASWLVPQLQCQSASAPDILVSNPQIDYRDEVTDWTAGTGVPRVIWPVSRDRAIGAHMTSDITMTLTEAVTGAA
jgi:hypothetical protein